MQADDDNKKRFRVTINGKEVDLGDAGELQFVPGTNVLVTPAVARKKGGCLAVLVFIIFTIACSLGVVMLVAQTVPELDLTTILRGDFSLGLGPDMRYIENPAQFDPIARYKDALDFAGEGAELVSIQAYFVRSDGTLDLTATYNPAPRTEYVFTRQIPPPEDAPPIGVGGSTGGNWYEIVTIHAERPDQRRHVREVRGGSQLEYSYLTQGWRREASSPNGRAPRQSVPVPECLFTDLWEEALTRDAPRDAVATILYDGRTYVFSVGSIVSMVFDDKCEVITG